MTDQEPPIVPGAPTAALVVAAVRVQDFRVLRDLCIELDPRLTLLVGENNTGKTALLAALQRAIGGARSNEDDLHVDAGGTRADRFVVDLRLEPTESYDFDDDLGPLFGGAVQRSPGPGQPAFVTLRTIGEVSPDGSGISQQRSFVQGWSCERVVAMGTENVAGEPVNTSRLGLLAYTLLDADRDLLEEIRRRGSHWGQLLADLEIPAADQTAIESDLRDLGLRIRDSSAALAGVQTALERLTSALSSGADTVEVAPLPPRLDELGRGVDVLVTAPGSTAMPLRLQGSGSRSLTSLLVFRAFVAMRQGADRSLKPHPVSAFEEPEAHLHPHAQQVAFRQLADLPGQQLVTTHSPQVAAIAELRSVRRFRRAGAAVEVHALGSTCSDQILTSLRRFVLRRAPEALFARLVILVEGETDESALRVLAGSWWGDRDVSGLGLTIVSVEGSGTFQHVAPCLEALRIPWLVLADGDTAGVGGVQSMNKALKTDTRANPERAQLLPTTPTSSTIWSRPATAPRSSER